MTVESVDYSGSQTSRAVLNQHSLPHSCWGVVTLSTDWRAAQSSFFFLFFFIMHTVQRSGAEPTLNNSCKTVASEHVTLMVCRGPQLGTLDKHVKYGGDLIRNAVK